MAVFTNPVDFVSLYGTDGLGWMVGIRDNTTDVNARKNAINWAYLEVAGIKGYWRRRSSDYTSSSSPALTAGTSAYNCPSDYNDAYRLGYREAGAWVDVKIVGDAEWLERSATRSTDAGDPRFARMIHNGTSYRFELDKPISAAFLTRIGTLTLEYGIRLVPLSGDTDTTILPPNLVLHLLSLAGYRYALTQGDTALADRLKPDSVVAKSEVLRYDLTRTGRPRQLRPHSSYIPARAGMSDYGQG